MAYEYHEDEAYLFRNVAENFKHIYDKSLLLRNVLSKWTQFIQSTMESSYTLPSARKFVAKMIAQMKKGQLPPIACDGGELQLLGCKALDSVGINKRTARVQFSKYVGKDDALQTDHNSRKCRHYCTQEQEFLFVSLAGRIQKDLDFKDPKQKAKFCQEMSVALAGLGYERTYKSVQKWISGISEGRWPAIAEKAELSWARKVLKKAFHFEDATDDEDEEMGDELFDERSASLEQTGVINGEDILQHDDDKMLIAQDVPMTSSTLVNMEKEDTDEKGVFQDAMAAVVNDEGKAMEVGYSPEICMEVEINTTWDNSVDYVVGAAREIPTSGEELGCTPKPEDSVGAKFIPNFVKTDTSDWAEQYAEGSNEQGQEDAGTELNAVTLISEVEGGLSTNGCVKEEITDSSSQFTKALVGQVFYGMSTPIRVKIEFSETHGHYSQALNGHTDFISEVPSCTNMFTPVSVKTELPDSPGQYKQALNSNDISNGENIFTSVCAKTEVEESSSQYTQALNDQAQISAENTFIPVRVQMEEIVKEETNQQSQVYNDQVQIFGETSFLQSQDLNISVRVGTEFPVVTTEQSRDESMDFEENPVTINITDIPIRKEPSDHSYEEFQEKISEDLRESMRFRASLRELTPVREVITVRPCHFEAEELSPFKQEKLRNRQRIQMKKKELDDAIARRKQYELEQLDKNKMFDEVLDGISRENFRIRTLLDDIAWLEVLFPE